MGRMLGRGKVRGDRPLVEGERIEDSRCQERLQCCAHARPSWASSRNASRCRLYPRELLQEYLGRSAGYVDVDIVERRVIEERVTPTGKGLAKSGKENPPFRTLNK